jgi:hypothetical protein
MGTVSVQWTYTKADMLALRARRDTPVAAVLARDINAVGGKQFADFETAKDAAAYAHGARGQPLYEVLENAQDPKHVVFDLDRPDVLFTTADVVSQFLDATAAALRDCFECDFFPDLGVNVQICTATTATKTSAHVRLDLEIANMQQHAALATGLDAYITRNRSRWPALVIDKLRYGEAIPESIVDTAIYTQFRSFRMLGMVKFGRDNPLVPYGASSSDVADHMVGRYAGAPVIPVVVAIGGPAPAKRRASGTPAAAQLDVTPASAARYEKEVNTWPDTTEAFGEPVRFVQAQASGHRIQLRCKPRTKCPYAGRPHKSNNIYLKYDPLRREAEVICYDEACREQMLASVISVREPVVPCDTATLADGVCYDTLHTQEADIVWDERYCEPEMRPYARHDGVLCIRANMGVGKTKATIEFVNLWCDGTSKVLFVFANRSLPTKLKAMLDKHTTLNFTNYQDVDGAITDSRVLCCLDSLPRVRTGNFDLVVVDEACTVLMHLNSSVMKRHGEVIDKFELFMRQSPTLFIDAVCDTTFVRNVADYVARVKGTVPYWVWNEYKRPTNRRALITVSRTGTPLAVSKRSLLYAALCKLLALLAAGKRVAVPSSTKGFTTVVEKMVRRLLPDMRVRVYNSETRADLSDVDRVWPGFDCVVYSPTITAGVSCEVDHFDCILAYFVNSSHTPPVEICMQMLWRVRNLADGDMHMFVLNQAPPERLPATAAEARSLLRADVSYVRQVCGDGAINFPGNTTMTSDSVRYDESRLSFLFLLGIVTSLNRSRNLFLEILRDTLLRDYGVESVVSELEPDAAFEFDLDVALCKEAVVPDDPPSFEQLEFLDEADYEQIVTGSEATVSERASARLHRFMHAWGVKRDVVDEDFYLKHAICVSADEDFYRAKRAVTAAHVPLVQSRERFTERMLRYIDTSGEEADGNLDFFQSSAKQHFLKLLTGQELLEDVLTTEQRADLGVLREVTVGTGKVDQGVKRFMKRLGSEDRDAHQNWRSFKKLYHLRGSESEVSVFRSVCKAAFGFEASRASDFHARPGFKIFKISPSQMLEMKSRYSATLVQ